MVAKAISSIPSHRTGAKVRVLKAAEVKGLGSRSLRASAGRGPSIYSFVDVYRADPLARVRIIKEGLPATYLDELARQMDVSKDTLLRGLGISSATVSRKVRESKPLSSDDSERALGMARLVGQVQAMVEESGNPEGFNAAAWLAQWLEEPLPTLGGQRPAELVDTSEGQAFVSSLLARMQSGAYG